MPPCLQASSVKVEGSPSLSRIVCTIFCIPLNENGFVMPYGNSLRILGTPRRGTCPSTASASDSSLQVVQAVLDRPESDLGGAQETVGNGARVGRVEGDGRGGLYVRAV